MLPFDREFTMLYIMYLILFTYILYNIINGTKYNKIRLLIILTVCILLNLFLYVDSENFKEGGSLVVLFYSGILFLITTIITAVNNYITDRKEKN